MSVVMWLQFFQGFALLQIKIDWFLNGVWFKVSLSWMLGWGVECGFSVCLCAGGPVRRWDGPASSWSSKEERSWWDSEYEPSSCEREASVCVKVCVSLCVCVCQLDCGIHPGLEGMDALPYIDLIDPAEIDLLLISQWVHSLQVVTWLPAAWWYWCTADVCADSSSLHQLPPGPLRRSALVPAEDQL